MSFVDQDTLNSIRAITREIIRGYNEPQDRSRILTSLTFKYNSGTSSAGEAKYITLILSKDKSGQIDFSPYAEGYGRITSEVNLIGLDAIVRSTLPSATIEFVVAPVVSTDGKPIGKSEIVFSDFIQAPKFKYDEVVANAKDEIIKIAKTTKKLTNGCSYIDRDKLWLEVSKDSTKTFKESWKNQKQELISITSDFHDNLGSEGQLSRTSNIADQIQDQQAIEAENRDPTINEGLPPPEEEGL